MFLPKSREMDYLPADSSSHSWPCGSSNLNSLAENVFSVWNLNTMEKVAPGSLSSLKLPCNADSSPSGEEKAGMVKSWGIGCWTRKTAKIDKKIDGCIFIIDHGIID